MNAIVIRRPVRTLTMTEPTFLLDEVERFAEDVWGDWRGGLYATHIHPDLDIYEEKDELVTKVELPGIRKEDIKIELEKDMLNISAEKKQETLPTDTTYYSCERCFGTYSRSVSLPFPVEGDKISATFENGLLEIRLPKAEEAKAKHIEVKVK